MKTSLPLATRIVGVTDESPAVRTLTLDLRLEAEPGQFVMAWLPGRDERPFSLVDDDPVTLTIARVGPFSTALHALRVGDRLWVRGPLGHPYSLPHPEPRTLSSAPPLLLIGGGYGVAPLHFLTKRALTAGWPVSMVIGARTSADVVLAERFVALGAQVVISTEDGSSGQRGVATDAAERLLDRAEYHTLYACGPEAMLGEVESLARCRGLPAQLSYERTMRCGIGVCGTCARQGWLVCRDGPVKEIEPGT